MSDLLIKGPAMSTVVEDVKRLVEDGCISREELELRLEASDLALLETKIEAAFWYDIGSYGRMMDLLRDREGAGNPQYWFRRGARSAALLIEHRHQAQMESVGRKSTLKTMDREQALRAWRRDLKLLVTLSASLINFGEWQVVLDPDQADRYRIECSGMSRAPEPFLYAAAGFLSRMATHAREDWPERFFSFERVSPDRIVFRSAAGV